MKPNEKRSFPRTTGQSSGSFGSAPEIRDPSSPSHVEIAARAFEIYQQRGGQPGRDQDDWFQAERELQERLPTRRSA